MKSIRAAVLDFANEAKPLKEFLDCVVPSNILWRSSAEEFCQTLREDPKPEMAIISLTTQQSRWLLRALQVNRFQFEMEKERIKSGNVREFFGAFAALHEFCVSGGSGLIVADIDKDQYLDAHAHVDLHLGPIREMLGPVRLAFVARSGIGSVPLSLLESPAKFGFVVDRSGPGDLRTPPEWRGLDFSIVDELKHRLQREFVDGKVRSRFLELCTSVFAGKKHAMLHALHTLRLCRRMVTWTLEGSPFRCTIFLGDQAAYDQKTTGTGNEIAEIFATEEPIPFDFHHLSDVRDLAEMIQSDALLLFINADDGCMQNISAHDSESEAGEHYWLEKYARLTNDNNCLVIHMRGGHFVELYGQGELRLWFDGYAWQMSPYHDLEEVCRQHFQVQDGKCSSPKASRILQVIPALLDEQKSSVLLLLNKNDEADFQRIVDDKSLRPLRPKIARWGFKSAIDRLPMSALEGILKLDGSHVIDHQGKLRSIAQKIGDALADPETERGEPAPKQPADNEGTGTRAARNLSRALPNSFVIKVSASGNIKIFRNGDKFVKE